MKKVLKVLLGIVALFVLGIVALVVLVPGGEEVTEEVTAEAQNVPEEGRIFVIGEPINYQGLEVTIVSAEFTKPNEYVAPQNGNVLTLEIQAVNNTDDKVMVDSTEFNLYDTAGNSLEQYFAYDETGISGTINSGKKLTGKMFFDVPQAQEYELIYRPSISFWDSQDISVKIEMP